MEKVRGVDLMVVVTDESPSTTGVAPPPRRLDRESVNVSSASPLESLTR